MAIIRENGRYGSALLMLLAVGCVSTDEPLFGGVAVPDLPSMPGAGSAQRSAESAAELSAESAGASGTAPPGQPSPEAMVLALQPAPASGGSSADSQQPPTAAPGPAEPVVAEPPPAFDPCGSPGLLLCDTFENEVSGAFPSSALWLPELSGCGTHSVDASGVSVSGTKALATVGGGYPECMLHADLKDAAEVYVRSWVRLGPEPELLERYSSLLELGPRAAQDEPELRIGLRPSGGSLCTDSPGLDVSLSGLQRGSTTDCSGFALEPERWYCLQAHVKRESQRLDYELAVDGVSVLSATNVRLGPGWNDQSLFFKVGRAAYGQSASGSLWHDDVAVSREPLPCGP